MPSITSLVSALKADYPDLSFELGDEFQWDNTHQTIIYQQGSSAANQAQLLHEVAHALLHHADYARDIELLAMERDAWTQARTVLGLNYGVKISEDVAEDALDSYRDWLHARSTCPNCQATGIEAKKHLYHCPVCGHSWRVNDARVCALRRYSTKK